MSYFLFGLADPPRRRQPPPGPAYSCTNDRSVPLLPQSHSPCRRSSRSHPLATHRSPIIVRVWLWWRRAAVSISMRHLSLFFSYIALPLSWLSAALPISSPATGSDLFPPTSLSLSLSLLWRIRRINWLRARRAKARIYSVTAAATVD